MALRKPGVIALFHVDGTLTAPRKTYKWAKRARKDPFKNYELYYEAFASRCTRGAFEAGMEENDEEGDVSEPLVGEHEVEGGTSQPLEDEDIFINTMRGALNSSTRPLNIASSSRHISKRNSKSRPRGVDSEVKSILKSIATTLYERQSSRGTSSGASEQVEAHNTTFQKYQAVISEMLLDDEQTVLFMEYINWNPNCQQLFLGMNESQMLFYALRTLKTITNQPGPYVQQQYPYYMNPAPPYKGSPGHLRPPVQNFSQLSPPFPQAPPNFNQPQPSFQQPTPSVQQFQPNFQNLPSFFVNSQFPPPPGPFGGTGYDEV